jgi:hypothetical protein
LNVSKDIKETFSTKDVAKEARQHLEDFRQGTRTIDKFFTLFETMASDAEITGTEFNAERIRLLEQLVRKEIIDIIYSIMPRLFLTPTVCLIQIEGVEHRSVGNNA